MRTRSAVLARRREELEDEAVHVRQSLDDLDGELAAGELDGTDYASLRARYEERAAVIGIALEKVAAALGDGRGDEAPPAVKGPARARRFLARRRHRLVLGWSAVACFAVAGALVALALAGVAPFAGSRPSTLARSTEIRVELAEAGVLASNKDLLQAVAVYDRVLELAPEQPQALADAGWLVRLAGLASHNRRVVAGGDAEILAAVKAAPGYALARAYDGVALYQDDHSARSAVAEFRSMLADRASPALLASVRPVAVEAYRAAGDPVPVALRPPAAPRAGSRAASVPPRS